ncbi:MAG TPA: hypothetical protein VGN42_27800 [Pirellulales bacterium]|nr:hypothetical protein [Pirellulales bacterium]
MRWTKLRLAWTTLRRPWMEAEGSATGAGGIGAASPAAGAGPASPAPPPQLLHPPPPQPLPLLQQLDLQRWHLNRLAKKPQRFRLQQLLPPQESQAGCSQQVGAAASQQLASAPQDCSQQFCWPQQPRWPQANKPFSRPNRHSLGRQHDEPQAGCSQHDGSQAGCSQQAGCCSQQLVSQH